MALNHDELIKLIKRKDDGCRGVGALLAVVELHKPIEFSPAWQPKCNHCEIFYPCPTIQAIEEVLV